MGVAVLGKEIVGVDAEGVVGVEGLLADSIVEVVVFPNGREGNVEDAADPALLAVFRLLGRGFGTVPEVDLVAEGNDPEGAALSVFTERLGLFTPLVLGAATFFALLFTEELWTLSELSVISGELGGEGEKRDVTGGVGGRDGGTDFALSDDSLYFALFADTFMLSLS